MTTLSAGVLLKLLDGMKSGAAKPVGEHRTAVLQVTDIVPADLDEKDLWPKHGQFYVKVSDSSHSIYATLPLAQADLVLSNKLQLGQFVHLDRLDPGSPVPVLVGARPLPGRHPLVVGTPDPASRCKAAAPRRGSWGPENHHAGILASPKVIKPTTLNFDERTPVKAAPSPSSVRKSSSVLPRFTRSKSFVADNPPPPPPKIPRSPFPAEKSTVSCTAASRVMSSRRAAKEEEPSSPPSDDELGSSATSSKKRPSATTTARVPPVPGKLSVLGKEAMEQREHAQKAALEALRNASATENVVRIYKMFSEVSKAARADAPAACFDGFLSFHQEAVQAVADIEAIQAATSMAAAAVAIDEPEEPPVLQELPQNRSSSKRRGGGGGGGAVSKSVSFAAGTLEHSSRRQDDGKGWIGSRKCLAMDKIGEEEKKCSALGSSLRLAKQMQAEAGSWFMEFVEAALETGLKKKSSSKVKQQSRSSGCCCPQSLIVRVINWVEMEQSGSSSGGGRQRAAAIARKLRIKAKNPSS